MLITVIRNFGRLLDSTLTRYASLVSETLARFVSILLAKLRDRNLVNLYESSKNELTNSFN